MHSCIYEGTVSHHRRSPVDHRFQYRMFMIYLDLDELPGITGERGLLPTHKYALRSFLRSDHLFDPTRPLVDEVRDLIQSHTGQAARGPIRLLTQLRYCGYYMSPLNLYYVFDAGDQNLKFIVAEVNNTPWNERHVYVLWDGNRTSVPLAFRHAKSFHVSPFMEMDIEYRWRLTMPASQLRVQLANLHGSQRLFAASLNLTRLPLSRSQLRRMVVRYPLMTLQITAAIYQQALQLWWKKCPFYAHPSQRVEPLPNPVEASPQRSIAAAGR